MINKEGFVLYTGLYDSIRQFLTLEQRGMLMDSIHDYQSSGIEPMQNSPIAMAFAIYKNQFRLDDNKQEKRAEIARNNGLKGGRPKEKTQEPNGFEKTKSVILEPNESYKEKVKDKVKEKGKVKGKDSLGESAEPEFCKQPEPIGEQQPIEQPKSIAEPPKLNQKSTLDFPTCEGHGVTVPLAEYPKQGGDMSPPFIHPSLVLNIPVGQRIDLWWKLYGVKQSEIKVESEMIQAGIADADTFAAIYLHTFLYVATTEKGFRVPPIKYWKEKTYKDDIVDRRKKKAEGNTPQLGGHEGPSMINNPLLWGR